MTEEKNNAAKAEECKPLLLKLIQCLKEYEGNKENTAIILDAAFNLYMLTVISLKMKPGELNKVFIDTLKKYSEFYHILEKEKA